MSETAPELPARWRILSQVQQMEVGADGRMRDVMEVTFTTARGTTGSVKVPLEQYGPEVVHALVDEYASRIEAVEDLAE